MIPKKSSFRLTLLFCSTVLFFLLFLSLHSYASEQFYTIQTGSFFAFENAKKQFDSLKRKLDKNGLHYLRIVRDAKYYGVRLGKFENNSEAENYLQTVTRQFPFPGVFILKVFINAENIVRIYQNNSLSVEAKGTEDKSISITTLEDIKPEKIGVELSDIKKLITEGRADEAIEAYKRAIDKSRDNKEKAKLHKELGDIFVSGDDYKNAAEEFIQVLSLSREFIEEERLQMAIYMSWGERHNEAIAEFKSILKENPGNLKARLALARVLSWSGKIDDAIKEADKVLKESPDNKDALLVKANAFRWRGRYIKAIPLYNKILGKGEDFDARLGQSYAYFLAGNIQAARRSSKLLKPTYPYQEKELNQFSEEMKRTTRPYFDIRYSYYKDSGDNIADWYLLGFEFWAGNWKSDIQYRHIDAKDNARDATAEDLILRTYSKATDLFGIGGGLGLTQMINEGSQNYFTWNIKADFDILDGVVGISLARDTLTDIAQLVENRIRVTNASLYISQRLTDRISLYGRYNYRDYSDDNNAHDFQLSPTYAIYIRNPRINLGYRFQYLDFNRQSEGGYFDPNDFISHQVFITLSFEKEIFYGYIEPFIGYQSFKRYGEESEDVIGGGYGSIGIKLSKNISFEVNGEGGNYAMETAAGWNYFMVGCRLLAIFK